MATLKPRPGSPSTLPAGTWHVVERRSRWSSCPGCPACARSARSSRPSARSTRKAVIRGFDPVLGRRGAREDREQVGDAAVRDPDLRPVQHVPVARAARPASGWRPRRCPAPGSVRAKAATHLARGEARQVPVLAARATRRASRPFMPIDWCAPTVTADARVEPAELLHDPGVPGGRQARAPVLLRDEQPEEPQLLQAAAAPRRGCAGRGRWRPSPPRGGSSGACRRAACGGCRPRRRRAPARGRRGSRR